MQKAGFLLSRWAGMDVSILQRTSLPTRLNYAFLGLLMALVFLFCLFSGYTTFRMVFGSPLLAVVFGLFWAFVVYNLYRFLLSTVNPQILPHTKKSGRSFLTFLVRYGFLAFLAMVVSKPLELVFYFRFLKGRSALGNLGDSLAEMHAAAPGVWVLSVLSAAFFMLPFLLKKYLTTSCEYEDTKAEIEGQIISSDYVSFQSRYLQLMAPFGVSQMPYRERYTDPPYNTELIADERTIQPKGTLVDWARKRLDQSNS